MPWKPFSFKGRISKEEYRISIILLSVILIFLVGYIFMNTALSLLSVIVCCFLIAVFIWLKLAQGTKRCHDLGKSGWWQFVPLYAISLSFKDGEKGNNAYGGDPIQF